MKMCKVAVVGLFAFSLTGYHRMDAALDVKGVPNEDGHSIAQKLGQESTTIAERFAYFSHYSPTIRFMAAGAMRDLGEAAVPTIIEGLKSKDPHVVRASCDAISGVRGFFGLDFKPGSGMAADLVAPAVPHLMRLIKRREPYIKAGALQALSRCGKAVAPNLKSITKLLKDDEWWVRVSASYVLQGVGSPEADAFVDDLAQAMVEERHAMCLNHMTRALNALLETASTRQDVARVISAGLPGMEPDYIRGQGLHVLQSLGADAELALSGIDAIIASVEKLLKDTEQGSLAAISLNSDLTKLAQARRAIAESSKP